MAEFAPLTSTTIPGISPGEASYGGSYTPPPPDLGSLSGYEFKPPANEPEVTPESVPYVVEPAQYVQHKLGGHLDVWQKLDAISFLPGSTGGMSQSIAYIRYWSRGGTQQKTPVQQSGQNTSPTDSQRVLGSELDNIYSDTAAVESFYNPKNGPYFLEDAKLRSDYFKNVTPDNSQFGTGVNSVTFSTSTSVPNSEIVPIGPVFSANPSGAVNGPEPAPPITDAKWQFLFNPEELQLESGPDYNRAETWAVSDPENSGQPLSWRGNKNRKLTFNKVILNGYVFGKRVDSLEKGLQDLFMARDGENGADGPPVLEFVWGKRVFGPCVIQNIRVRERAWDAGTLVNAEVSFDLEQVPEWTINDGYVDVLRPGRQPTVNDKNIGTDGYRDNAAAGEPTPEGTQRANKPGGGGGKFDKEEFSADYEECVRAQKFKQSFNSFAENKFNYFSFGNFFTPNLKRLEKDLDTFTKVWNKAAEEYKKDFTSQIPDRYKPNSIKTQLFELLSVPSPDRKVFVGKYYDVAKGAAVAAAKAAEKIYNSTKCKNIVSRAKKAEQTIKGKRDKQLKCEGIKRGLKCITNFNKPGSPYINPCNGKTYICGADQYYK